MIWIQKGCLASFILIISFLAYQSTAAKTTSKIISLKYKTQLIENYHTSGSPSFIFGTCDPRSRSWERSCLFALQTKKPVDSLDHVKICEFRIKPDKEDVYIGQILEVHSFGDDKAILTYKGKYNFIRFAVLHFSNCQAVVSKIDDNLQLQTGTVLANDGEIFDIIERKYGSSCGHFAYNKMILDSEGNVITKLNEWLCNEEPYILAAIRSPLKGHLIVDSASMLHKHVRVMEVNKNATILKEFANYESFSATVATSNTQQKLSICYQINLLRFNCSQYDHNGGLQFETSFEFEHPISSANIYNLPDGGFVLLAQESIRDDNILFSKTQPNNLVVMKINAQGKLVKITELPEEFNHTVDFTKIHFHINEHHEYCFSYIYDGLLAQNDKLVNLATTCFDDYGLISSN